HCALARYWICEAVTLTTICSRSSAPSAVGCGIRICLPRADGPSALEMAERSKVSFFAAVPQPARSAASSGSTTTALRAADARRTELDAIMSRLSLEPCSTLNLRKIPIQTDSDLT